MLVGLGLALQARHLWAAYALAGYSILAAILHVSIGMDPKVSIPRGILLSLLYLATARQLLRAEHIAPSIKGLAWRHLAVFALKLVAGTALIAFFFAWGHLPIVSPFGVEFLPVTRGFGFELALEMAWALVLFTRVARQINPACQSVLEPHQRLCRPVHRTTLTKLLLATWVLWAHIGGHTFPQMEFSSLESCLQRARRLNETSDNTFRNMTESEKEAMGLSLPFRCWPQGHVPRR
jgi:hypothetical protein